MRKPLQRHWCQVCRLSIRLNYRLTWVANPREKTEAKTDCLLLCCCIFVFCYFCFWGGFRWKSFKAKTRVFSVLVCFKRTPLQGTFTEKQQWDRTEEMELPILWESLPLLTKLICKMAQLQQFSSLWIPKKVTKKYKCMLILRCTGVVWLINMSSWQEMFSSFFNLRKFIYLCLPVLLWDIILSWIAWCGSASMRFCSKILIKMIRQRKMTSINLPFQASANRRCKY